MLRLNQLILKPQDLLLALKVAINSDTTYILAKLGQELDMALSAVHASVVRCEQARLISRSSGNIVAQKSALIELVLHGVRYVYPPIQGTHMRGYATATAGPSLSRYFDQTKTIPIVWPDPAGETYGSSLAPLHPSAPQACRLDPRLYDVLTLVDALRVGAARERTLATTILETQLS